MIFILLALEHVFLEGKRALPRTHAEFEALLDHGKGIFVALGQASWPMSFPVFCLIIRRYVWPSQGQETIRAPVMLRVSCPNSYFRGSCSR